MGAQLIIVCIKSLFFAGEVNWQGGLACVLVVVCQATTSSYVGAGGVSNQHALVQLFLLRMQ